MKRINDEGRIVVLLPLSISSVGSVAEAAIIYTVMYITIWRRRGKRRHNILYNEEMKMAIM